MNRKKTIKILLITSLFLLIPLCFNAFLSISNFKTLQDGRYIEKLQTAGITHHNITFENPTFEGIGVPWNSVVAGDTRDVKGYIDLNQANYELIGDIGEIRIDEPLNDTDWTAFQNPDLPILPDRYDINSSGCHVSHLWHEDINQTRNRPSVHWKRTITMPVDMRDYIITSASLQVVFNATVSVSPHALPTGGEGIDRFGDDDLDAYSTGDYTEFYAAISDTEQTFPPIQVAYNNTGELGRDSPSFSNYTDSLMSVVPENVLISILTSALATEGYNFTITLGIDIYCEDNEIGVDIDRWNALIIRSFNLTFSYEKKIDQFTTISWDQTGDEISGNNIQITHANLSFNYKADRAWPVASSPNSELRVLINDNQLLETIKLSTSTTSFRQAKEGGFDVTSLILKDVNITLSIQIFLADEFTLDQNITISIDDVFFTVFYIEITSDSISEPWFFAALLIFAIIVTAITGGYLIAYQKVLKYPRPVRKVRKYKRTLNRKNEPQVVIIPRESGFNKSYNRELAESSRLIKLKGAESTGKAAELGGSKIKQQQKLEKEMTSDQLIESSIEKKTELDKLVDNLDKK
ncbi:MAG: hypothetical protein ACFE8B_07005 [Candidatus Hermodarchaeota archaeon]